MEDRLQERVRAIGFPDAVTRRVSSHGYATVDKDTAFGFVARVEVGIAELERDFPGTAIIVATRLGNQRGDDG